MAGAQSGLVLFDARTGAWSVPASTQLEGKDISRLLVDGQKLVVGIKTSTGEPGVWLSDDAGGRGFGDRQNGVMMGVDRPWGSLR